MEGLKKGEKRTFGRRTPSRACLAAKPMIYCLSRVFSSTLFAALLVSFFTL